MRKSIIVLIGCFVFLTGCEQTDKKQSNKTTWVLMPTIVKKDSGSAGVFSPFASSEDKLRTINLSNSYSLRKR